MIAIFKALGDESRLRILNIVMNDTVCVCQLEECLEMSQTNVSRHLFKLKSAGLVTSEKKAQWIYYKSAKEFFIKNPGILEYLHKEFSADDKYMDDIKNYYSMKDKSCEKSGCC